MAKNYGIKFCERVLANLKSVEDQMIEETGFGFDLYGEQFQTELKYRQYLKQFREEKRLGLPPSYDPEYHGEDWD